MVCPLAALLASFGVVFAPQDPQSRHREVDESPHLGRGPAPLDVDQIDRQRGGPLVPVSAGVGTSYPLCGPAGFLAAISAGLESRGVAANQIDFETFGPAG